MDNNNNKLDDYLLKEQIIYDSDKEHYIEEIKNWTRRLVPILGGTIATTITSKPAYLGIGATLLILMELGINIKDYIIINNMKDGYKLDTNLNKSNNIIDLFNHKTKKDIIPLDKALNIIHEDLELTTTIYEIDIVLDKEELDIILTEIDKLIIDKGYERCRLDILKEYYKRTISKIVNDESGAVDYFDFMNNLYILTDIGLCTKKEILVLAQNIVNSLNKNFQLKK